MDGIERLENGWWWPVADKDCKRVVFATDDMELAMELVLDRRICLQAGGNCGVWPKWLATKFERVYTFEPDDMNYHCLGLNLSGVENIFIEKAVLGLDFEPVDLEREKRNCGAHFVKGPGNIPSLTIDSLELPSCGLMVLDIEGKEPEALLGAEKTLLYKPVLMYEDKGLSTKYGYEQGWIENWAEELGYKVAKRIRRDVILEYRHGKEQLPS